MLSILHTCTSFEQVQASARAYPESQVIAYAVSNERRNIRSIFFMHQLSQVDVVDMQECNYFEITSIPAADPYYFT